MKIAVWYHGLLSGNIPSEDHALSVLAEQMTELKRSGLADAASEIHVGINGPDRDALLASSFCPDKTTLHCLNQGRYELATMRRLQAWLRPGWAVFYHHIKGVKYPDNPIWSRWRRCMQRHCVTEWRQCAHLLERGIESCGAHWLTQQKYPFVTTPIWGGNFWWSTSDFLLTLPPLPPDDEANKMYSEVWIGRGKRHPRVIDFAPHFPMHCP